MILVDEVIRTGFLTSASKIGIQWNNTADLNAYETKLKGLLTARGLHVVGEGNVPPTSDGVAAYSALVLQFKSKNIDRILSIATSPYFFMLQAESQAYRPKYVVTSEYGLQALNSTGSIPKAQLQGSQGIGWAPFLDVDSSQNAKPYSTAQVLCEKIMKDSSQASTSATTQLAQRGICDGMFFLQTALRGAGAVSSAVLQQRASSLRSYVSPVTFATSFSRNRPDGAAAFRDQAYDDSCSCFTYTSAVRSTG